MSGLHGHLWEQFSLPRQVDDGEVLWSPANSGPLWISNQVLTLHDVSALEHPEWFSLPFAAWYRWLLPRLVNHVRRVITISEFSRQRILETFRLPDNKVISIPEGVDQERFHPISKIDIQRVRERYNMQSDYLLVVATLEPRKNLGRLLEAWKRASEQLKSIWLVVAGGTSSVFRTVDLGSIPQRVRWLGYVDEQELPALYSGALAFILPSLYEGFGLSVVEAMACGAPVIVSRVGALPEVVGKAGLYVDPQDADGMAEAICRLAEKTELQETLRCKGMEQARQLTWERTARAVRNILLEEGS